MSISTVPGRCPRVLEDVARHVTSSLRPASSGGSTRSTSGMVCRVRGRTWIGAKRTSVDTSPCPMTSARGDVGAAGLTLGMRAHRPVPHFGGSVGGFSHSSASESLMCTRPRGRGSVTSSTTSTKFSSLSLTSSSSSLAGLRSSSRIVTNVSHLLSASSMKRSICRRRHRPRHRNRCSRDGRRDAAWSRLHPSGGVCRRRLGRLRGLPSSPGISTPPSCSST